jgi:hypothetical protein
MREIKFRGWDEEQKKMIGWEFLSLGKGELLNLKGVMQFTGLLDKQGKDIYEGDILQIKQNKEWFSGEEIFKVEYKEGYYKFFSGYSDCEIIGNVWENPELMQ